LPEVRLVEAERFCRFRRLARGCGIKHRWRAELTADPRSSLLWEQRDRQLSADATGQLDHHPQGVDPAVLGKRNGLLVYRPDFMLLQPNRCSCGAEVRREQEPYPNQIRIIVTQHRSTPGRLIAWGLFLYNLIS
jgi:hypothetical protein